MIWHLTGEPASGVRVQFIPTSDAGVPFDTLATYSDAEGIFELSAPASGERVVQGRLLFQPPAPYNHFLFAVDGVHLETTRVRGDARNLGMWGVGPLPTEPHISYVGGLYYRDTGQPAEGVEVEFRRTGGIAVEPDTFVVVSGENGRFPLLMDPAEQGAVIGEILVRPPAPYKAFKVAEVRIPTLLGKDDLRLLGTWGIDR